MVVPTHRMYDSSSTDNSSHYTGSDSEPANGEILIDSPGAMALNLFNSNDVPFIAARMNQLHEALSTNPNIDLQSSGPLQQFFYLYLTGQIDLEDLSRITESYPSNVRFTGDPGSLTNQNHPIHDPHPSYFEQGRPNLDPHPLLRASPRRIYQQCENSKKNLITRIIFRAIACIALVFLAYTINPLLSVGMLTFSIYALIEDGKKIVTQIQSLHFIRDIEKAARAHMLEIAGWTKHDILREIESRGVIPPEIGHLQIEISTDLSENELRIGLSRLMAWDELIENFEHHVQNGEIPPDKIQEIEEHTRVLKINRQFLASLFIEPSPINPENDLLINRITRISDENFSRSTSRFIR